MIFETKYKKIVDQIKLVNPIAYGKTRNHIDGAVTRLSPYLSRGVISTRQVLESVLDRGYRLASIETFVKELCWRDYFQRVAQVRDVMQDLRQPQEHVRNHEIPENVITAQTGIEGIDAAIEELYQTGYMHNHCRMYTSSLVCNIAGSHWLNPSRWMYYHLLDGDFASNACSWQWVSGSGSSKKYFANQENISRFTSKHQTGTYLDVSYEQLTSIRVPERLTKLVSPVFTTNLPDANKMVINPEWPTFIYNYYNLDPNWHREVNGNRILLIEPDHFNSFPVSDSCIAFMMSLSNNIPGIQMYVGSFDSLLNEYSISNIIFKEHPLNRGYRGTEEPRDWICEEVSGYFPSFFSYWNKISKQIGKTYKNQPS